MVVLILFVVMIGIQSVPVLSCHCFCLYTFKMKWLCCAHVNDSSHASMFYLPFEMYHTIHFKRLWFEIISNTFHVGWHLSLQIHRILSPDCVSAWNYEIIFHLNEIFISNRSQTILTHFLNIVHWHCQYNNTFYSPFNSSVTRAFLSTFHDNFLYPHNFFVHCFDQIRFQSIGSQEIFNLFEQVALLHEAHCTTKKKTQHIAWDRIVQECLFIQKPTPMLSS